MSDTTQIERQLYILSLLSEHIKGYTIEDIISYLSKVGIEVSKKTVERDIDSLSMGCFPAAEEIRGKKTYYFAQKFGLDNISFTISELLSLYFLKEVSKSYAMLDIGMNAGHLLDRFIANLPQINQDYINNLKELVKVNPVDVLREKAIDPSYVSAIRDAIALKKRLSICYDAFNSEETTHRKIDPYHLEIHEGCYHLVGHCHLRDSIREFRVSRIAEIEVLEEAFEKPSGFYEIYQKNKFDKLSGEQKINLKLKFSGHAARFVKEYESDRADLIQDQGNGEILFEKTTTMTPESLKWVLGYGTEVEVLEPKGLREEVVKEARKMLERYGENLQESDGG